MSLRSACHEAAKNPYTSGWVVSHTVKGGRLGTQNSVWIRYLASDEWRVMHYVMSGELILVAALAGLIAILGILALIVVIFQVCC
ncbi:MAG TPA: hypothetical protein VHP35_19055 [Terriglobia bacterium]|jgi:hypothetical protein|nr:hypothetical protein [Terriglobia bacterium]